PDRWFIKRSLFLTCRQNVFLIFGAFQIFFMKNSKTTCYPTFTKAWIPLLGIITALTFSCSGSNFLSNKTPRPFTGLAETGTFFSPVPRNQGFTHDGKYWYISPDHSTIEKRRLDDFELIESATHPDKIG